MRNGITQSSGARVVVEHNAKTPSMISQGILVYPGTETNIGIQRTHIERLKKPYKSKCTTEYLDTNIKSFVGNSSYSSRICRGLCYINKIHEKCDCMYPTLIEGYEIDIWFSKVGKGMTTCNMTAESEDFKCINSLGLDEMKNNRNCYCHPECNETKYKVGYRKRCKIFP